MYAYNKQVNFSVQKKTKNLGKTVTYMYISKMDDLKVLK